MSIPERLRNLPVTRDLSRSMASQIAAAIKPGQRMELDPDVLGRSVKPSPGWSAMDWLLEQIPGSAYEFFYEFDPVVRRYRLYRLSAPLRDNLRTYVSPDRRHLFKKRDDGFYEPSDRPNEEALADFKRAREDAFFAILTQFPPNNDAR